MKRYFLVIFVILFVILLFILTNNKLIKKQNENIDNQERNNEYINKESEKNMINKIKVIINEIVYNANLESNETTEQFLKILPIELNMNELNGNEKYIYLNTTFTTNSYKPNLIKKGDIMLYENNCLVLFYKSFNTSYSYTKI